MYCDIHTHILPGVDDGARSMEDSMDMLAMAYESGARRIFLTPHFIPGRKLYTKANLKETYEVLKAKAAGEFPELELFLGNELLYVPGIAGKLRDLEFTFMADSRYALVEFDTRISFRELYGGVRELTEARILPIIAHWERYECLFKKESNLKELRKCGAYFQMNGEAFQEAKGLGKLFSNSGSWFQKAAASGYVDFIGSDAHGISRRSPDIKKEIAIVEKNIDTRVLYDNSQKILENKYL